MPVIYTEELNKTSGGGRQLFPPLTANLNNSLLDNVEVAISIAFTGMSYGEDQKQYITLDIVSDKPDVSGRKTIATLSCPAINNQPHVFQCVGMFKRNEGSISLTPIFNTSYCTITGLENAGGYFSVSYI